MSRRLIPLAILLLLIGAVSPIFLFSRKEATAQKSVARFGENLKTADSRPGLPGGNTGKLKAEADAPNRSNSSQIAASDSERPRQSSPLDSDAPVTLASTSSGEKDIPVSFAELAGKQTPFALPKSEIERLFQTEPGDEVEIPLNPPLKGVVTHNTVHKETGGRGFGIALKDYPGAHFSLTRGPDGHISGDVLQSENPDGFLVYEDDSGRNILLTPSLKSNIVCTRIGEKPGILGLDPALKDNDEKSATPSAKSDVELVIPDLESRPGARRVIYLDFDGEVVQGTSWVGGGRIDAQPYENQNNIPGIWASMSEDFAPFNVNVTTTRSVFDSAPTDSRCMVIFTPTNDAAPGAGGVAYLNSFGHSVNYMCWVFNRGLNGAAEAGSHEVGHQVSLRHDGTSSEEYYHGHTHTATGVEWGPIMGASYGQDIVQWSRGEYIDANRTEDDLAKITGYLPYLSDDHGNTLGSATNIPTTILQTFSESGIIERNNDVDVFRLDINDDGTVTATANPAPQYRNLDIQLELLDSSGTQLDVDAPAGPFSASVSADNLPVGTYYIRISGSGLGATGFAENGYNEYGSLGRYTLSGTYPFLLIPQTPDGLTATDGTSTDHVVVSWNSTDDTDGYHVYRNTVDSTSGAILIADVTSGTSYTDTTALHAVTYYYFVSAYNSQGESDLSASDSGFRRLPPPATPTSVSATDGTSTNYVRITWAIANYAYSYEIWRNSVNSTSGATVIGTAGSNSFDDTTSTPGEVNYYFVRAVNPEATSSYSTGNSGYKRIPPPGVPTGVTATDGISDQFTNVSWTAVDLASGYYVLRNTTNSSDGGALVGLVDNLTTSIQDTTGIGGVIYYYFVSAFNDYGTSNYSAGETGYRRVAPPAAPANVMATRAGFENAIRVDWSETDETTNYFLYRNTINDPDTAIFREKLTNNRYYDSDALPGRIYYYFIKSANSAGRSQFSSGAYGFVGAPDPEDDRYENNDTFEFANPITQVENEWLSEFHGPGVSKDIDWYCFQLDPTSNRVDVIVTFSPAGDTLQLDLYDDLGNLVASGIEGVDSLAISYSGASPADTYYLAVSTTDYTGLVYDLIWKSLDPGETGVVVDNTIGFNSVAQKGDGVVNESAAAQTITSSSSSGKTHNAYISTENESALSQKLLTHGTGGNRYFSVSYFQYNNGSWENATGSVLLGNAESLLIPFDQARFRTAVRPGKIKRTKTKQHFVFVTSELDTAPEIADTNRFNVIKTGKKKRKSRSRKR